MTPRVIPAGERYGRLVAIVERRPGEEIVRCRCDCGKDHSVSAYKWGRTRSCGCLTAEHAAQLQKVHGRSGTPTYRTWKYMIQRCNNPNNKHYADYGGRGITVCGRWRDFRNFFADMGERPEGETLDRVDNDGSYEPGNCRWATASEQMSNRRPLKPRSHCGNGHEFTPENTRVKANGSRVCRACARHYAQQARQRREAA